MTPRLSYLTPLITVLTSSVLMKIMCYKDKVDIGGKQAYEIL